MNLYTRIVADKYPLIKGLLSGALSEKDDLISQKTAYLRQNVIFSARRAMGKLNWKRH
jgi:hypothetical protein